MSSLGRIIAYALRYFSMLLRPSSRMSNSDSETRSEQVVFEELSALCVSAGYIHALAYLCFRDNTLMLRGQSLTADDVLKQYGPEKLIRTEFTTLIGLMIKQGISIDHPGAKAIQEYIERSDLLLSELHRSMELNIFEIFNPSELTKESNSPFTDGSNFREPIFYAGESAYDFQYRDLVSIRYENDDDWIVANKGFRIAEARDVLNAIERVQLESLRDIPNNLLKLDPDCWTAIDAYSFTLDQIASRSNLDKPVVKNVINEFSCPLKASNQGFNSIGDFNLADAYPIIPIDEEKYLLFSNYSSYQALYENPFYWFNEDKEYLQTALKHRGEYTESLSETFLIRTFGKDRVWKNVTIHNNKGEILGEVDVLVVFGKRVIIIQAKSKRLTVEGRKGNDHVLKDDFKKAIQNSYDQGFSCGELLSESRYSLSCGRRKPPIIQAESEFFILCVISDHYPALSFQSRFFLKKKAHAQIRDPFVLDVFLLDVLTEFLTSPLFFLSYIDRRVKYADRVLVNHEFTTFSFHLRKNLWIDEEVSMVHLGDDITADLDSALMVRRQGIPGAEVPEGILTKYKGTIVEKLIEQIDHSENPAAIDLGFLILEFSEDTMIQLNTVIEHIAKASLSDGGHHDFTMGFDDTKTGICIHCNFDDINTAGKRLQYHMEKRKYAQKARTWFGICLDPNDYTIRLGAKADFEWKYSADLDQSTKGMPQHSGKIDLKSITNKTRKKVGRNDPCPCGSGKKYKRCCL